MKYKESSLGYIFANYAISMIIMLLPMIVWATFMTMILRFPFSYNEYKVLTTLTKIVLFVSVLLSNTFFHFHLSKDYEHFTIYFHKPKIKEIVNRAYTKSIVAILLMISDPIIWAVYGVMEVVHILFDDKHRCMIRRVIDGVVENHANKIKEIEANK